MESQVKSHGEFGANRIIHKVFFSILKNHSEPAVSTGGDDVPLPRERYNGRYHPLKVLIKTRQRALCSFTNIQFYPFKTEECSIHFYLDGPENQWMDIHPFNITNNGPQVVDEYIIKNWTISPQIMDGSIIRTMKMTMILDRKLENIFLVTYLPTIFMNIINQATNYVQMENKVITYLLQRYISCLW